MLETMTALQPHPASVTFLSGGICRCNECGETLLEDERHWHVPGNDRGADRLSQSDPTTINNTVPG